MNKSCLWYPVDDLFQRLSVTTKARQVSKEIIKKYAIEDSDQIEAIETNVQDFLMLFLQMKVLVFPKYL